MTMPPEFRAMAEKGPKYQAYLRAREAFLAAKFAPFEVKQPLEVALQEAISDARVEAFAAQLHWAFRLSPPWDAEGASA
jgi:hypothetical protein